ncbi:MAG: SsrA-binding protein SmpB [Trueperaceae bacterium]|nr:SsrA-binding protein SmpB [Trueperaceae bacterium]
MLKNRRATFDYEILETYEAGIALTGSEVKSLREGQGSLNEAFARIKKGEVWLEGMNIPVYQQASYNNHEPLRSRKLLLQKKEIAEIARGLERKGLTVVPMSLYFKSGWAKVKIGLGRGKKLYDKRQSEAKRDAQRQIERVLKRY